MLTDVVQLWEELSFESEATGKYLERLVRPDNDIEIVLGCGAGRIALIIAADLPSNWVRHAQIPNCMSCEQVSGGVTARLKFHLKTSALENIFIWFSQDVANRLKGCTAQAASDLLSQALVAWAEAFRVDPEKGMSRQAQQGLFAELFFLEEFLIHEYSGAALLAWHSQNSVHDFQIEQTAWEVKSYGGRRMEARISSEDQLDDIGLTKLILVVAGLKISEEAGISVTEIVDRLACLFADNNALLSHFRTGLAKYGYIDESSVVRKYFFTPRLVAEYAVTDDFPKIIAKDIPSAISNVKYVLTLASLEGHLTKPMVEY